MIPSSTSFRVRVASPLLLVLGALLLQACRSHEKTEVEVEVRSVGYDNASRAPVVVLQDADHKVALPIWIGPAEAQSIAMQLQGINPPRPMTHDLIKSILDQTGVEFQRVVIQELRDSTYYARICLHAGRKDLQIDSRPSDAIALAIRFRRPIFVATALMQGDTTIDLQRAVPAESLETIAGITVQNLSEEVAEYFDLPAGRGVIVADVGPEAAPGGLQRGDVILDVDGARITGVGDFAHKLRTHASEQPARLSVQRGSERLVVEIQPHTG